jgi:hypothetical protein
LLAQSDYSTSPAAYHKAALRIPIISDWLDRPQWPRTRNSFEDLRISLTNERSFLISVQLKPQPTPLPPIKTIAGA